MAVALPVNWKRFKHPDPYFFSFYVWRNPAIINLLPQLITEWSPRLFNQNWIAADLERGKGPSTTKGRRRVR